MRLSLIETGGIMDVKDFVKKTYDEWNKRDKEAFLADYSDSAEIIAPGGLVLRGRSGVDRFWETWQGAFPDNEATIHNILGVDDQAALEAVYEGPHIGVLRAPDGTEMQPTGHHMSLKYSQFFVVRDDKVVSMRLYYDQLDLLTQLGQTPAPNTA
jgi:ketosteroid isomerase-like protein